MSACDHYRQAQRAGLGLQRSHRQPVSSVASCQPVLGPGVLVRSTREGCR